MRFDLGSLVATPAALRHCQLHRTDILGLVQRHVQGDWGDLDREDKATNERSILNGARILSAYVIGGEKVYIITEAQGDDGARESTCVLLASEY